MSFTTIYQEVLEQLDHIDPIAYGKTRNFIDGAVTKLSPYISRGVISTKMVMEKVLAKGHDPYQIEKFLQELAWRDYWQQVWIEKGEAINQDLKHQQWDVAHYECPEAILDAQTGITAIDQAIEDFYQDGYLHNHVRMYIAAIACNVGKSHWKVPAQWMYYHLLDGDWASNALSWQWVAGANANKKYVANQANINRYCHAHQQDGFLNVPYSEFEHMAIPDELATIKLPELATPLPETTSLELEAEKPVLVYNYYNLDPQWRAHEEVNRVLLLEPSVFENHPIGSKSVNFMLELAKNIAGIKVFTGEFEELCPLAGSRQIIFKEHPLSQHYRGQEDPRDWMFSVKGYFPSFFGFWKKCRKELK